MKMSKGSTTSKSRSSSNRSEAGKKAAEKTGHAKLSAAGREGGRRSHGGGRR